MSHVDTTRHLPTVLSFCSGYAGIERGLDLAGVEHRVVAYVEIEAFAVANLVTKMENGKLAPAPIFTDLKTFPSQLFRGGVDIITGGYPCQPFSAAGKRLGRDDPRHLWPFIDHHIGAINPGRVFFENVEGHVTLGLNTVISDLEARGYDTTWGIFSAAEVGAPHQRKRVYIMGDAVGSQCDRGADQQGWLAQERATADGAGKGSRAGHVADANGGRGTTRGETREGTDGAVSERSSEKGRVVPRGELALAAGERPQGERDIGNTCSEGTQPYDEQPPGRGASQVGIWPPEPAVGRVVDGCADRVDRIRLLGNGVVPQTAATAWLTLDAELRETL